MPNGRTWTDEEIIAAVRSFAEQLGRAPTMAEWRKSGNRPSGTVIAHRLGWNKTVEAAGFVPLPHGGRKVTIDREGVIKQLRLFGAELGHPPSRREWEAYPDRDCSADSLVEAFGTYSAALEAAGFSHRRGGDRRIPKETIVHAIQDVAAQFGYLPRVCEWKDLPDGGPVSMRTIENTFGSYSAAATAAGFVAPQRGGIQPDRPPTGVEDAAIAASLIAFLARERKPPTRRSWIASGLRPSVSRIESVFGSWNGALHAAMIEPRRGSEQAVQASDEDLLFVMRSDRARLGRWPTAQEWRETNDGRPNVNTVINRFGSWEQAKTRARLHEAGSRKWIGGNLAPESRARTIA